ncbi:TlpA disulfide reductase family protein [Motilimonas sp. 1_MG-2023]|uniref:TlpA family protein disulfide reductase n=1 Tax=Motilimonas sp. 1_MG-2023 TaxID=3062672 RepID=UPI0026E368EB|nr:TlpA disulfide reductase family protein [Motilimonas sp. 1_MG-2023]MDO6525944.1 TlpA disulfide reductase family protein [Motilimonas sp. 1_MG-2023]
MEINMKKLGATLLIVGLTYSSSALAKVGDMAPNINATTINGQAINFSELKGKKPIYLKFWATWCSYCKAEMPHLQRIQEEYGDEIEVLTVNVGLNDSVENVQALFKEEGYTLPVIFDKKGDITAEYQVVGTPFQVLINKQGEVVYETFLATDELSNRLAALAQE